MGKDMKIQRAKAQWNFPLPKRGKARMIGKVVRVKKAMGIAAFRRLYNETKYVRHGKPTKKSRIEQAKWSCSLKKIYTSSEKQLLDMLLQQGFLKNWKGKQCPHCGLGQCSPLHKHKYRGWTYRCGRRACRNYVVPHFMHPVFSVARGQDWTPLRDQAAVLWNAVARVKRGIAHLSTEESHKVVEAMYTRLNAARARYVERAQKKLKFGIGEAWKDVEADEVDLRKTELDAQAGKKEKATVWEQWGGLIERGAPNTLVLVRLKPNKTRRRAPGPGAMRKRDWVPIASRYIKGRKVILHTDGARAYRMHVKDVIHNNVVHKKKRVQTKDGKWIWVKPHFVRLVANVLPNGKVLHVKTGTQIIDRVWQHVRKHLEGNYSKVGSSSLRQSIRSAQWVYWNRGEDLWKQTGLMLKELMDE